MNGTVIGPYVSGYSCTGPEAYIASQTLTCSVYSGYVYFSLGGQLVLTGVAAPTNPAQLNQLTFVDFALPVNQNQSLSFYHVASDCSDARLLELTYEGGAGNTENISPIQPVFLWGGKFYAASSSGVITGASLTAFETVQGGLPFSQPGTCNTFNPGPAYGTFAFAPLTTYPLPPFVAPFSVQIR